MKHRNTLLLSILLNMILLLGLTACSDYETSDYVRARYRKSVPLTSGTFKQKITIRSKPTTAMIYINEEKVGKTPFTTTLEYGKDRLVTVKAIPIYPNQFTQNIILHVPPVPKRMTIYMDHQPIEYGKKKDKTIVPPERHPEVRITKVDTVYVERVVHDLKTYTPPVLYFDNDKNIIKPKDELRLKEMMSVLKANPDLNVDIYGFADVNAKPEYNKTLSYNRAMAVYTYLVDHGVNPNRLRPLGHGQVTLTTDQGNLDVLAPNRKVMFQFYKISNPELIELIDQDQEHNAKTKKNGK